VSLNCGTKLGPYEILERLAPAEWARSTRPATLAWTVPSRSKCCQPRMPGTTSQAALWARGPRHFQPEPSTHPRAPRWRRTGWRAVPRPGVPGRGDETLEDRLHPGPLPLEQALRYAVEIAGALDQAHRLGVIHRDLKPANVMLTRNGVGAGRRIGSRGSRDATRNCGRTGKWACGVAP
jgi:hypothetical protein